MKCKANNSKGFPCTEEAIIGDFCIMHYRRNNFFNKNELKTWKEYKATHKIKMFSRG
jgi:hypothetical protein